MGVIATSTPPSGSVIATGRDGWQTAAAYLAPDLLHGLGRHAGEESWIEPLDGTLLMADISGFTRMSERLAEIGKEGAEWLTNTINHYFESMLDAGRRYGGSNLKFGGDALLLSFTGDEHARRAVRAALAMQSENRRFTAVRLAKERIRLKMSIGAHSGRFWSATAGVPGQRMQHFVLGADACRVAGAEAVAEAGEVVVTPETIELLGDARTVEKGGMSRVLSMSRGSAVPVLDEPWVFADQSVISYLPPPIAAALQTPEVAELGVGEHRKTTVIFLHVLGVEALIAGEGPATALKELQEYVSLVVALAEKYGGFLAGSDIYNEGLKLILVFGAPVAREQDAANALRLSLELRERLPELGLRLRHRMGVNSGHVFAGDIGTEYRREYTVMGDAVNLAARLMSAAAEGQVLASKRTIEEAGSSFDVATLDPIRVKGKRSPIEIGAVEREVERSQTVRGERAGEMVGREAELALLREVCRDVEGGDTRAVALSGEPGIGKSRLTAEFLDYLAMRGWAVHRAQCQSHLAGDPFAPWGAVLSSILECGGDATPRERMEAALEGIRTIEPRLVESAPLLRAILALPFEETEATRSLDDEARRRRLFDLVAELIVAAARARPLAVVFEDVHWADHSSLQLASHVGAVTNGRVLLLLTARTLAGIDLEPAAERVRLIALDELPPEGAVLLVRSVLGVPSLPAQIAAALMAKARGNPLFLAEVARSLRESGEMSRLLSLPEHQLAGALAGLDIPDRVQSLIMSRIDALGAVTREVLRGASVIGASFDEATLRAVLEADIAGGGLERSLRDLARTELIEQDEATRFHFGHALMQDVAYESLLYSRRRKLHQRAGSYIELMHWQDTEAVCETLVHHYMRGGNKPRALLYSVKAGDKARLVFANEEAIEHYVRAVGLARDVSARDALDAGGLYLNAGAIHTNLGDVLELTGAYRDAVHHYSRALSTLSGHPYGRRRSPMNQAESEELAKMVRAHEPAVRQQLSDLCRKVGYAFERQSRYGVAHSWHRHAIEILPRKSHLWKSRASIANAGVFFREGRNDEALAWCLKALRHARKSGDEGATARAYKLLAVMHKEMGAVPRAVKYGLRAVELYRESGDLFGQADTLDNLAADYVDVGEWEMAESSYGESLELATRIGDRNLMAIIHNNLGELLLARGETGRAKMEFRWTIEACSTLRHVALQAYAQANLGEALALEGRLADGFAVLRQSLAASRKIDARAIVAEVLVRLAGVYLLMGETAHARDTAEEAVADAKEAGSLFTEASALRVLGRAHVRRGDWQTGEEELTAARQISRRAGAGMAEAKSSLALAQLYAARYAESRAATDRRKAIRCAEQAAAVFRRLGAVPDLTAAEQLARGLESIEAATGAHA